MMIMRRLVHLSCCWIYEFESFWPKDILWLWLCHALFVRPTLAQDCVPIRQTLPCAGTCVPRVPGQKLFFAKVKGRLPKQECGEC